MIPADDRWPHVREPRDNLNLTERGAAEATTYFARAFKVVIAI